MPTTPTSSEAAREALARAFGFSSFNPGQEEVVTRLLAGRSVLAVFPTGAGKSLCYQLPSLLLDGLTLVVSPLIALMKDQVDALARRGIAAARLDSSLSREEVQRIHDELASGRLRLLFVAPERLANERFVARLRRLRVALLAIDEAHCISEWGHNFRPDYLKMARFAADQGVGRVLALTATATPAVAEDVCRVFGIQAEDHVQTGFHRPNLELHITPCRVDGRDELLLERLQGDPPGAAIVYVTLQRTAEEVAAFLSASGLSARAYHAGLEREERSDVQDAFMGGSCRVVVATIAFGMGIDKADIRAVYHYNLPKTLENYVQEVGRAGRDGAPARCEVLASADDRALLERFTFGDTPAREALAGLVRELLGLGERFSIAQRELSTRHDIRPLVLSTALTYLELAGVLQATGPHYTGYKLHLLRPLDELLVGFDRERAAFLAAVFGACRRGKKWHHLEPDDAARAIGQPRGRILAAVGYLEEQGALEVEASGLRHGYVRLREPDPEALADELAGSFAERERRDVERVAGVVAFAEEPGCLTRRLLAYFGEALERDCEHCGRCQGAPATPLPASPSAELGPTAIDLIQTLARERRPALTHPRQVARFLCGLPSPAASRAGLQRDRRFGCLEEVPFPEVLRAAGG